MRYYFGVMTKILLTSLCLFTLGMTVLAADAKKAVIPAAQKERAKTLPFSPAILTNDGTLYVSGHTGPGPDGKIPEDFEQEVKNTLDAIRKVMQEVNYDLKDSVAVQVYLTDMSLFPRMNTIYMQYFTDPRPARTTVGIAKLVGTARIEITVTAKK